MNYRTKTYISAEWDGDHDAVEQLHKWNDNDWLSLSFTDAHDLTQARDSSLNCSIKKSLAIRFDVSKTFVLIVGDKTKTVRSGSCEYCSSKNSWTGSCARNYTIDNRSYIEYECEKAINDGLRIVVLYNATTVVRGKCPDVIKYEGTHTAMCYRENDKLYWDYQAVKKALE